jgi:GDP-6-deoxy-D-talose 4-dehydrogenase
LDLVSKKVLITGIDSFTGKHLTSYLEQSGYDVYGTSLFIESDRVFKCDITDKENILNIFKQFQPDCIIHLSGISFAVHGKIEDFYNVNTIGTTNILESLVELNINPKKIVLASSATVYGNQGLEVLDESLCPTPANHYGASKYTMECLARNYFNKLNIIITRPFNYTGIGQADHFLIPKIVSHFKQKKEQIELGNVDVSREFNDIGYVCEIYEKLLSSKDSSEIVNISSNRVVKLVEIIDIMNQISGYEINVKINQDFVRKDEIKSLSGSTNKLFSIIGNIKQKSFSELLNVMYNGEKN